MPWTLRSLISRGPFSEVHDAVTPDGTRAALKLLTRTDALSRELFEKQALLLVRLRHPNVVPVLGFLKDSSEIFGENRGPCYWMAYVEGTSVTVAARKAEGVKILHWFEVAVETLGTVHAQGVVHGDLSPQNLRIDSQGHVWILDFSVLPGDAAGADVATLPYLAPERITSPEEGALPSSVDLFSLGTVFYEAFAGVHPRANAVSLRDLINRVPAPLIDVAPKLAGHPIVARTIDRMIRSRPSERFVSTEAVREALSGGNPGTASSPATDPVKMLGADPELESVAKALAAVPEKSLVLAVHGPSGVGKTRFVREIVFEAALKGIKAREFLRLHRAGAETLPRLLSDLRNVAKRGEFVVIEWNDAELTDDRRRFFDAVLADGLAREIRLKGLGPADTRAFLETALKPEDAADLQTAFFGGLEENPGKILKALKVLTEAGRIRKRSLVKGWREALRTPPPPIPWEELKAHGLQRAEEHRLRGQPTEALEVIDAALGVVDDPAERSRLLRVKINVLNGLGRFEPALAVCQEWIALAAPDEPMNVKTVKYWFTVAWIHQNLGRHREATEAFDRCVAEGAPFPEESTIASFAAEARALAGVSRLQSGDTEGAIAAFAAALGLIPETSPARAETYRNLARAHAASGDVKDSEASLARAFALYEAAGREDGIFWTLLESGNLRLKRKEFEGARSDYTRAEGLAEKAGSDLRLALAWNNRGLLESEAGNPAEALDFLQRAQDTLRFLGNANDLAHNLRDLAVVEAQIGRFPRAEFFLKGLRALSLSFREAGAFAGEAEASIASIREGNTDETAASLKSLFDRLPPELQVSFVDRGDYRRLLAGKPPAKKERPMETKTPAPVEARSGEVLATLTRLNEKLLAEEDIPKLLGRLMDAAMELARAENGFLILRSENAEGPLPGYRVAVARNIAQEDLQTDLYAFSLSAVRRSLQTGEPVLTDNAVLDPVFEQSRSVHLRQLKSIVALPVRGPEGVLGVFYLDHRFHEGLFGPELLDALKAFASVASLALQKGRMIDELKKTNDDLSDRVRAQTLELHRNRLALKNEYSEIVGRSRGMVEVLSMVDRIADSRVPVWVFGESGTGKEAVARALHAGSPRAKKTFVTENCGALPESLMESELFGHKKGAFTHATNDRQGILKYADGGTIFLDEIADMSPALQAKLLRFLQEGEIRPVGSTEVLKVDVRVVSASNKDLSKMVAEGKFREDLYYRLNGVTLKLPPLRERMEDLSPLAEHFLKRIAEREKKAVLKLAPQALNLFLNYRWPGNIRELQNTLETAALFAEDGVIGFKSLHFKPDLLGAAPAPRALGRIESPAAVGEIDPVLEETLRAVKDNGYHKGHAAEALGISRRALYGRFQKFGLATDVKTLKEAIDRYFPG